ncbi:MAG: hypothetical protein MJE66_14835, partial [Proteobacteria bacterium]|nr:hypothetical protein [Pseudomonadota bacterium]
LFDGRADRDDDPAEEVVWVECWGGGRVPTSPAYAAFIEHYRDIGRSLAAVGIRVVNCTEGGARIPGLEHVPFARALLGIESLSQKDPDTVPAAARNARPLAVARVDAEAAEARGSIVSGLRTTDAALARAAKARRRLRKARSGAERVNVLQGLVRDEQRVRGQLQALGWIEAVCQEELYAAQCAARRSTSGAFDPMAALDATVMLFEAVRTGLMRGGSLMDHVREQLARVPLKDDLVQPDAREEKRARHSGEGTGRLVGTP